MMESVCKTCQQTYEPARHSGECFKCHVKGVTIGYTYGKENFHGPTIKERQEQQVRDAAANGVKAEPVGTRWV